MNRKKIGFNLGSLKISGSISKDNITDKIPTTEVDRKSDCGETAGFGSFGKIRNELIEPIKESDKDDISVETNPDIAKVMGFSGFGDGKKARNFDMAQIMEEA